MAERLERQFFQQPVLEQVLEPVALTRDGGRDAPSMLAMMSLEDSCNCNSVCPIGPDGKYMCHLKQRIYKPCAGMRTVRCFAH